MDPEEAQQHLLMVDTILRRNDTRSRAAAAAYILWGVGSALYYVWFIQAFRAFLGIWIFNVAFAVTLAALAASVWTFRLGVRDRVTVADRQALAAFAGVTVAMVLLKLIWNTNGLVPGPAYGIVWTFGFAVALTLLGSGGQPILFMGGIALFCGIFFGSLVPSQLAVVLFLANLTGIAGPGIYFALRRSR